MSYKFLFYKDYLPEKGLSQVLPDHEVAYDSLLDAVTKGSPLIDNIGYKTGVVAETSQDSANSGKAKLYYFYKKSVKRSVGRETNNETVA